MNTAITFFIVLCILGVGLSSGAVLLNDVPILDPPGWKTRIIIYLTKNSAEIDPDSPLPELRPGPYPVSAEQLFDIVREAVLERRWRIASIDPAKMSMHVVVKTALLGFKDDMTIRVATEANKRSSLHASSKSRIGRADYGANLGHILKLKRAVQQKTLDL